MHCGKTICLNILTPYSEFLHSIASLLHSLFIFSLMKWHQTFFETTLSCLTLDKLSAITVGDPILRVHDVTQWICLSFTTIRDWDMFSSQNEQSCSPNRNTVQSQIWKRCITVDPLVSITLRLGIVAVEWWTYLSCNERILFSVDSLMSFNSNTTQPFLIINLCIFCPPPIIYQHHDPLECNLMMIMEGRFIMSVMERSIYV